MFSQVLDFFKTGLPIASVGLPLPPSAGIKGLAFAYLTQAAKSLSILQNPAVLHVCSEIYFFSFFYVYRLYCGVPLCS